MKRWVLNWLGLTPSDTNQAKCAPSLRGSGRQLFETQTSRNFFEIIPAINGKIVVYNRHTFNQNGPDKNDMEVYLVHDGDNLMDTITTAIVSAGLK